MSLSRSKSSERLEPRTSYLKSEGIALIEFTISCCQNLQLVSRKYEASKPEVALKRFLNYLRLHKEERPIRVTIEWEEKGQKRDKVAMVEWYFGKLEESSLPGEKGTWYRFKGWYEDF